ncbi:MAG: TIGR04255 family protein [Phycisphaerales bacterium]|nr:TIGR04255 family protein [Phycisphaerales bacterium]
MKDESVSSAMPLPKFDQPPVIEVVCGILFHPLDAMLAPHFGQFWERLRAEGYTSCQEQMPLAPIVELFGEQPSLEIQFSDKPPLPRIWFVRQNDDGIVQLQRDRFLHNWKKTRPEHAYPNYEKVISLFRQRLDTFERFLRDGSLGQIQPRQYEMTYVNHIPQGSGWDAIADLGHIFPEVSWRNRRDRFLSALEAVNLRFSFQLPDGRGRLHATIRSALRRQDNMPVLLLEMNARGMPEDASRDAMWKWFDVAHEWIVLGFTDLTSDRMHQYWKRTQ